MASKAELKFVTTIATITAVTQTMRRKYAELTGRERIKGKLDELENISWKYLAVTNKNLSRKDIKAVEQKMAVMSDNGLESVSSYKSYMSFILALLDGREQELKEKAPKSPKMNMVSELTERVMDIYNYFDIRARGEKYDHEGLHLEQQFNRCFQ